MNKKTVVICLNNAWQAYNFRLNLARFLKSKDFDVIFILPFDNKYVELIQIEFVCYNLYIDAKGINPKDDLKTIISLYKIYKKINPDIVLNFTIKPNIYSSLVCRFLNISVISNITGLGTVFIKESFITKIAKILYKTALSKNEKVYFQNNDDKNLFVKLNLVKDFKTDLLPGSGVDLKKFLPKQKKIESNKIIFLMVSRLLKDKGIYELIDAIKLLNEKYLNFEVQLLGSIGVENNTAIKEYELKEWIDGKLITYLGTTDNVQDVIVNCDCVILPSYREGTPRSLLEAAAMEKPIITTNTVGCKEVVDDNINGFLCEVKSSIDLAEKMAKIISLSEEERKKMGDLGRKKIIENYDENIVLKKYYHSIKEILFKELL